MRENKQWQEGCPGRQQRRPGVSGQRASCLQEAQCWLGAAGWQRSPGAAPRRLERPCPPTGAARGAWPPPRPRRPAIRTQAPPAALSPGRRAQRCPVTGEGGQEAHRCPGSGLGPRWREPGGRAQSSWGPALLGVTGPGLIRGPRRPLDFTPLSFLGEAEGLRPSQVQCCCSARTPPSPATRPVQ